MLCMPDGRKLPRSQQRPRHAMASVSIRMPGSSALVLHLHLHFIWSNTTTADSTSSVGALRATWLHIRARGGAPARILQLHTVCHHSAPNPTPADTSVSRSRRMEDSTAQEPAKTVQRLVAISGSLRRASANTGLIRAAAEICKESIPGMQVDHVDISDLPLLNTDLEVDGGFPPAVEAFRYTVRAADCFLFASPEYNYSISGPLKNALDWGSRPPNCWADRAAAILSASGGSGGSRSQYHIRQVGVFLDIHFINKPEIFTRAHLPPKKFDADGNLIDPETREQLRKMLLALQTFALRLQGKPADAQQSIALPTLPFMS